MSHLPRILSRATPALALVTVAFAFGLLAPDSLADESAGEPPRPVVGTPFFFALSVADVEQSAGWYSRVFGYELVRAVDVEARGLRIRLLRTDGGFLELIESSEARAFDTLQPPLEKRYQLHGVFKIGLEVADLDETVSRLEALEVALRGRVVEEPDGSMRSLQVEDPDGQVIQLFEIISPAASTASH